MKTGEGKTLVATLSVYLNALEGKGVHVVTVNDYLARRDAEWMGAIYTLLGLRVGCIVPGLSQDERRQAYAADVTYCTNNELGFDCLRDNMAIYKEELVQRGYNFAGLTEGFRGYDGIMTIAAAIEKGGKAEPEAIREALGHPREVDQALVRAQETRRIIDRLFGYDVSPLLWRKIRPRLSAGRGRL